MCYFMIKNNDTRINAYMLLRQNEQNKNAQRESELLQKQQIRATNYSAIQAQNSINNANSPKTYYQTGNYIYQY